MSLLIKKKVLLIIRSDPRKSHRPSEGIRIALGLVSGGHQIEIILSQKNLLLFSDNADETLVDGDLTVNYLSTLQEFISTLFIDGEGWTLLNSEKTPFKIIPLSKEEILSKITAADCFFTF